MAIVKLPIVNYFSKRKSIIHFMDSNRVFSKIRDKIGLTPPGGPGLEWVDSTKVYRRDGLLSELSFRWENDFPFEYIHGDYAGNSVYELADLYRVSLMDGI